MRTTAICLLVAFISLTTQAQIVFCPPNATWTYLFNPDNLRPYPSSDNEKITYVGDSLIGPDTVKVLSHLRASRMFNLPTTVTLIKQIGNTVFFRNRRTDHTWQVLYDFGADVNDTWPLFLDGSTSALLGVTVLAKYDTLVAGHTLKKMKLEADYGNYKERFSVVERLGADQFLFFFYAPEISDGDAFLQNLCYTDGTLGTVKYSSLPCDFDNLQGIASDHELFSTKLFPNPVINQLQVKGADRSDRYEVSDARGTICAQASATGDGSIQVGHLQSGIYYLRIIDHTGLTTCFRFIKQ